MIEVERNNGGVHNVERILVQNALNVCVCMYANASGNNIGV